MRTDQLPLFELENGAGYTMIYEALGELREEFHRSGRLDDSNAKLDEVVKLFATYLAFCLGDITGFPAPAGDSRGDFVERLQRCFREAAQLPYFMRNDGVSIFGSTPSLILQDSDASLAIQLTRLVRRAVDEAFRHQELGNAYDVLNEAFGHFVRDNFRGNIEDAQYLTPTEVVDFMASIALEDLSRDGRFSEDRPVIVADPCCGVGSFLTAFAGKFRSLHVSYTPHPKLYGQDKVERMVRLTTINLTLFRVFDHRVSIGNSLYKGSCLDELNGSVDLILTNPPFGARFSQADVATHGAGNVPFFSSLRHTRAGALESELLFVDRNLKLLREGGRLLIVVPDSVISASGIPALLRHHLRNVASLEGVIGLPAVTFAQAGTRTKTAVLYLRKGRADPYKWHRVFMAVSSDLGFQVNSRKGVKIKVDKGKDELPTLLDSYRRMQGSSESKEATILSDKPSAVAIPYSYVQDVWTPGYYQANAYKIQRSVDSLSGNTDIMLGDLVDFVGDERRLESYRPGVAFISVLHVIAEGILDIRALKKYAPKTPGVPVKPGEVLLSRINPRIPRVLVVPDLGQPMVCSSEFEIMRAKEGVDPFMIAFLLLSHAAQDQIQSLTSGTSASHNRVKTRDLARVSLPVPRNDSGREMRLQETVGEYRRAILRMLESHRSLVEIRERMERG